VPRTSFPMYVFIDLDPGQIDITCTARKEIKFEDEEDRVCICAKPLNQRTSSSHYTTLDFRLVHPAP
jgi:hypothetical protein